MSGRASVLDYLVFRADSVEAQSAWTIREVPSTTVYVSSKARDDGLKLPVPLFSRRPAVRPHQVGWSEFCSLLRRFGIPVYATVTAFESLPAASTPSRFGVRYADYPLEELEITTADAFEIVCRRGAVNEIEDLRNRDTELLPSTWPLEVRDQSQLISLVALLSDVSGGDTPIGIGLPIGTPSSDIEAAIQCGFDFITLELVDESIILESALIDLAAHAVVTAREVARSLGKENYSLFLDLPIDSSERLIRFLALGASAVTVDGLVALVVAEQSQSVSTSLGRGMLSGISAPSVHPRMSFAELEIALQSLLQRLRNVLSTCGCSGLGRFDRTCLLATHSSASKLTGTPLLGD